MFPACQDKDLRNKLAKLTLRKTTCETKLAKQTCENKLAKQTCEKRFANSDMRNKTGENDLRKQHGPIHAVGQFSESKVQLDEKVSRKPILTRKTAIVRRLMNSMVPFSMPDGGWVGG
jgi:hypothetical protein